SDPTSNLQGSYACYDAVAMTDMDYDVGKSLASPSATSDLALRRAVGSAWPEGWNGMR
nr:hypothetical protein [Tanacetum cinerariifolium]